MDERETRLANFRVDVRQCPTSTVIQKYYEHGPAYALDENSYFDLRAVVASNFKTNIADVVLVGSGKTGFSIAPTKRYRLFSEESDIDIAIVSPALFDSVWRDLLVYDKSKALWDRKKDFCKYLFSGWLRPDLFPEPNGFPFSGVWREYFRSLSCSQKYGERKVAAGIYKDWFYFEQYHLIAVSSCKDAESRGE